MFEVNTGWVNDSDTITVITALPTREGVLSDLAESLLPTLVAHSHVLTALPVHELHWPIVWARNLPNENVEELAETLRRRVTPTGRTMSVEGTLQMIPVGNPDELGVYLDESAEGMDALQQLVRDTAQEVLGRSMTSSGGYTGIAHLSLARCHTADVVEDLADALGTSTTTVEIGSIAVIRQRFDAWASCVWWETVTEVAL